MDDGVDVARSNHFCDNGTADVGAYEIRRRSSTPAGSTWTSSPTTSTAASVASERANRAPRSRETPVTRTTLFAAIKASSPGGYLPARRRWIRVRFSSLRCFFFAIRLRRFLMTEPTDVTSRSRDVIVVPDLITCRRLSPDNSRMLPGHDRQMRVRGRYVPGALPCAGAFHVPGAGRRAP